MTALYHYHTMHLNDQREQVHNSGTFSLPSAILCDEQYQLAVKTLAEKFGTDKSSLIVCGFNLLHPDVPA